MAGWQTSNCLKKNYLQENWKTLVTILEITVFFCRCMAHKLALITWNCFFSSSFYWPVTQNSTLNSVLLISGLQGCLGSAVTISMRFVGPSWSLLCHNCLDMHGTVYEFVRICMCVWSGHSLEEGTMAFLCSDLQVAVETQSQTEPSTGTQSAGNAEYCCLPPETPVRIGLLFQTWLRAINAARPPLMTKHLSWQTSIHRQNGQQYSS